MGKVYRVSVWVPSKGWKCLKMFHTEESAITYAEQLHPLETRLERPGDGRTTYGGRLCVPNFNVPEAAGHRESYPTVTEIEVAPTQADLDYAYRVHGGSKMS